MAAGDTYALAIKGAVEGQQIVNVHHFRAEGAGDLSAVIPAAWETHCKTAYLAMLPGDYGLQLYSCRQINPPGPAGADVAPTGGVAGTLAGAVGPLTTSAVITWRTGYSGRSRRGRSFIGPPSNGDVGQGLYSVAYLGFLNAYAAAMIGAFGPAGSEMANARLVIWSHTVAAAHSQAIPPAMGDPLSASAYVLSGVGHREARVQRRRELGRGA